MGLDRPEDVNKIYFLLTKNSNDVSLKYIPEGIWKYFAIGSENS